MKASIFCLVCSMFFTQFTSAQTKTATPSSNPASTYKAEEDFSKKKKNTPVKKAGYKAPRKVLPPGQLPPANSDKTKSMEEQIKDADQSDLDQAD